MIAGLAENLLWTSLIMLIVLVIRRPVAAAFGAPAAYALWLLPALRLVMPDFPAAEFLSVPVPAVDIVLTDGPPQAAGAAADRFSWWSLMRLCWLGGAAAFLLWQVAIYRAFLTSLSLSARGLGSHQGLPLIESAAVKGPLALGLLDRRIVVPLDFATRYSPDEQRLALEHEAVHHRRGDIWLNVLALLVLALNWFNPIAWFAFRAFREDQELACDAAVAASAAPAARHDYARALIKSASRPGLVAACPLNRADQLKRRLKMMKQHGSGRLRMLGGAVSVVVLGGLTASLGAAHPHPEGEGDAKVKSERVIIMQHGREGARQEGEHKAHSERVIIRRHPPTGSAAGGEGEAKAGQERHEQHVIRMGHGGGAHVMTHCADGEATEVNEGEGNERTRVVLCSRGDAGTPAERADRLQRARERMAQNNELSAEHRARVLAAMDRAIAQLRGQRN
ncbi:MAG: M56 family metallopeptidase [Sphingosinicella sp.]